MSRWLGKLQTKTFIHCALYFFTVITSMTSVCQHNVRMCLSHIKKFKFNDFTIRIGDTCREDAIDMCEYCNDKLPNALGFAKQVFCPKTRIFISWHLNAVCNLFIWRKCKRVFWMGGVGGSSRRMEPETL